MRTDHAFDDYAIAIWGLPVPYGHDQSRVGMNTKDGLPAKTIQGEFHLMLIFDPMPGAGIAVRVRDP